MDSLRKEMENKCHVLLEAIRSIKPTHSETAVSRTIERDFAITLPELPLRDAESVTQLNEQLMDPVFAEQMV